MSSASSTAFWMEWTVLSMLTTTPLRNPSDGETPTPMIFGSPFPSLSQMMQAILVVPMSSPADDSLFHMPILRLLTSTNHFFPVFSLATCLTLSFGFVVSGTRSSIVTKARFWYESYARRLHRIVVYGFPHLHEPPQPLGQRGLVKQYCTAGLPASMMRTVRFWQKFTCVMRRANAESRRPLRPKKRFMREQSPQSTAGHSLPANRQGPKREADRAQHAGPSACIRRSISTSDSFSPPSTPGSWHRFPFDLRRW